MLQTTFLWYLVQVNQYQSLSIAAEKLHVSQPALSSGIKKLEQQLGTKLLERTYKGITLTEDGKKVVTLAEQAFGYLDKIETLFQPLSATNLEQNLSDLTIYCNPAYTPMLLKSLLSKQNATENALPQLFELTPEVDVRSLILNTSQAVALGIVSETDNLLPGLSYIPLCTSKAYVQCSRNFPYIPPNKSSISFKELVKLPLAISKKSFGFQKSLHKNLQLYGEPNVKVLAPNQASIATAVHSGIAYSFTNNFFASTKDNNLRYIPIRNSPKYYLALTYNRNINPQKITALAELLKQHL